MATINSRKQMAQDSMMDILISFVLGANLGFLLASLIASGKDE